MLLLTPTPESRMAKLVMCPVCKQNGQRSDNSVRAGLAIPQSGSSSRAWDEITGKVMCFLELYDELNEMLDEDLVEYYK